jgi:hypothetical protein
MDPRQSTEDETSTTAGTRGHWMEVQMKTAVVKSRGRRSCQDKQLELSKFVMVSTGQKDKI